MFSVAHVSFGVLLGWLLLELCHLLEADPSYRIAETRLMEVVTGDMLKG
jgi:hypothetical protein